jgi:hypothetical protein
MGLVVETKIDADPFECFEWSINNQGVIIMGSKDKRKESKGKKPQPKPVPAGK